MELKIVHINGSRWDTETYGCIKNWRHPGEHEFVKREDYRVTNLDFEDALPAIQRDVNEGDNRYQYSLTVIREAVFKFVCDDIQLMLENLADEWYRHNGKRFLGKPDVDLGPVDIDPYCVEASCC